MPELRDGTAPRPAAAGEAKDLVQLVYILQALAIVNGLTAVAGILVNLLKRDVVSGTVYETHFDWQLKTVFFALLGYIAGLVLMFAVVGFFLLPVVTAWYLYRVGKGWYFLRQGREMGDGLF